MKKFLLILALATVSVAAHAQFAGSVPEGALKRKGSVMKTLDKTNKVKLTPEQVAYVLHDIDGVDYNDEWNQLNRTRKKGVGLIVGGSIAAGTGALVFVGAAVEVDDTTSDADGGVDDAAEGAESADAALDIDGHEVFVLGAPLASMDESGESMEEFKANLEKEFAPWYIGSGLVTGAGAACAIAGIPTTVSSCKKMNAIVNRYNETRTPEASLPEVTLNFGRTANGVGLTLNF